MPSKPGAARQAAAALRRLPLRIPLRLLNVALRLFVKRRLRVMTDPGEMRAQLEANAGIFPPVRGTWATPDDLAAAGRPAVPARCVQPSEPAEDRTVLYLHGGAYIAGSPLSHAHVGAALARAARADVVLPDYRLAPEHPWPAALEDAETAYRVLLEQGQRPERIAVAGDSAGGGLAAALLLACARGGLPQPGMLIAFSPWADLRGVAPSWTQNAKADAMLPAERLADVRDMVLQGRDPADPTVSPALARFADPPPALIFASRAEILMDDAAALAERLRDAGGTVRLELWDRVPHAWPYFAGRLRQADRAIRLTGEEIRTRLP